MSWRAQLEAAAAAQAPPAAPRPAPTTGTPNDTPYGMAALSAECAAIAAMAPDTGRNAALNKAATRMGSLIAAGRLTEATVLNNLAAAARACGLPEHEIRTVLRDNANGGLATGKANPRVITERTHTPTGVGRDVSPPAPAAPAPNDDAFWAARPELDHIRTFARARRACPWAVLGVVLARVIVATPKWVVLPPLVGSQASLNLFVGLVAPSGGGKGASEACASDAVNVGHVDSAGVGSGEGIAHLFMRRDKGGLDQHREAVLMQVTEIDTLAALGDRKGATLLPELRKAWSGEKLGFAYADPTKALPLEAHAYRLCMVAGVQPGRAQWVLDDADGGTPQRFLWLPAVDPAAPDMPPPCPTPLVWAQPDWVEHGRRHGDTFTERAPLPVCDTARDTIDQARLARLRGDGDALDGHALLARLKVAAALAIYNGRAEVTDDDWGLSEHVAVLSESTRQDVVDHLRREAATRNQGKAEAEASRAITVSERQEAEAMKKAGKAVIRKITAAAPASVTRSHLIQGLTPARRGYLDAVLDGLVQTGQIVVEEGATRRWKLPT